MRTSIWILCLLGAVRVLAFAAAYPLFDFIDEALHLEVVVKYVRGGLPVVARFDPQTARWAASYGSDYLGSAPPARDLLPPAERERAIAEEADRIGTFRNCEDFAPPLYYVVAAGWFRLGEAMGLRDGALLYWLRFLSAPLYGAAILLACRICTEFHQQRSELALGVGLLMAVFPQDVLYSINADVLSPLAVTGAIYLLLRWLSARPAVGLAACAGLAAAMAMLVKYSNVGVLAVIPIVILMRRPRLAEVVTLLLCATLPLAAWMLRCQFLLGDWTAASDKVALLDWTPLSLRESLHHPIFGPLGFLDFLSRLCVTFWRGEFIWNGETQRVRWADIFYLGASAIGLLGTAGWLLYPSARGRAERRPALLYFVAVAGSVLFLAAISARFDYGHCTFPSRGFPYFAAGRLLTGFIAPFAILLIGSFEELVPRRRSGLVFAAITAVVCAGSELYLSAPAFKSPHNWYSTTFSGHLPDSSTAPSRR